MTELNRVGCALIMAQKPVSIVRTHNSLNMTKRYVLCAVATWRGMVILFPAIVKMWTTPQMRSLTLARITARYRMVYTLILMQKRFHSN